MSLSEMFCERGIVCLNCLKFKFQADLLLVLLLKN